MKWCNDCRQIVETERREWREWHNEVDSRNLEVRIYECCERCGGTDIEDTNFCPMCDAEINPHHDLCQDCMSEIGGVIQDYAHKKKKGWSTTLDAFGAYLEF